MSEENNEEMKKALEEREKEENITFDDSSSIENKTEDQGKSLGKVKTREEEDIEKRKSDLNNRVEISSDLNVSIGYSVINTEDLPSKGRFYPKGLSLQIRSAESAEIEHWSTMNEEIPLDVDQHFQDILNSCLKIKAGARPLTYKYLLEADKLYVILKIHEKTFDEIQNRINLKIECQKCGHENKRYLESKILDGSSESDEVIERYYDEEGRRYSVKTKSYGTIDLFPPTLGTMDFIFSYIKEKRENKKYYSKALMQLLPYLVEDFRDLTDKDVEAADMDMKSWPKGKLSLIYRLIEKIKIGVKPTIKINCSNCGRSEETPVRFPNGPKDLFIISDIEDELI